MSDVHETSSGYPMIYRNLMVVGLLGAMHGLREDSDTVNSAVDLTLDDAGPFRVLRAIAQGIGGDAQYAVEMLGRDTEGRPDEERAKVALATALLVAQDARWRPLIEEVLAISSDPDVRETAIRVMDSSVLLQ